MPHCNNLRYDVLTASKGRRFHGLWRQFHTLDDRHQVVVVVAVVVAAVGYYNTRPTSQSSA